MKNIVIWLKKIKPDVLIEDDCKSIGGDRRRCITYVDNALKKNIKSVIVEEFKGIDELKDKI